MKIHMKKNPHYFNVEVEYNGTKHKGKYTINTNDVVEVSYGIATIKTQAGESKPLFIARQLLREILEKDNWRQ